MMQSSMTSFGPEGASNKSSLFIGDLAIFCTEVDIEKTFAPYGEILEIKIMKSEETSRNLSYGFIKFSTPASAKQAMDDLNGMILCGRPLRIRWASYKNKNNPKEAKMDFLETSPVHVSFISYQIERLVTEESLRSLFSKYGTVVDASIKKSMIDKDVGRQSGYGFVHYSITTDGIQSAINAANALDDGTVDGVNYKCSISHNLNKHLSGALPAAPAASPHGVTVNAGRKGARVDQEEGSCVPHTLMTGSTAHGVPMTTMLPISGGYHQSTSKSMSLPHTLKPQASVHPQNNLSISHSHSANEVQVQANYGGPPKVLDFRYASTSRDSEVSSFSHPDASDVGSQQVTGRGYHTAGRDADMGSQIHTGEKIDSNTDSTDPANSQNGQIQKTQQYSSAYAIQKDGEELEPGQIPTDAQSLKSTTSDNAIENVSQPKQNVTYPTSEQVQASVQIPGPVAAQNDKDPPYLDIREYELKSSYEFSRSSFTKSSQQTVPKSYSDPRNEYGNYSGTASINNSVYNSGFRSYPAEPRDLYASQRSQFDPHALHPSRVEYLNSHADPRFHRGVQEGYLDSYDVRTRHHAPPVDYGRMPPPPDYFHHPRHDFQDRYGRPSPYTPATRNAPVVVARYVDDPHYPGGRRLVEIPQPPEPWEQSRRMPYGTAPMKYYPAWDVPVESAHYQMNSPNRSFTNLQYYGGRAPDPRFPHHEMTRSVGGAPVPAVPIEFQRVHNNDSRGSGYRVHPPAAELNNRFLAPQDVSTVPVVPPPGFGTENTGTGPIQKPEESPLTRMANVASDHATLLGIQHSLRGLGLITPQAPQRGIDDGGVQMFTDDSVPLPGYYGQSTQLSAPSIEGLTTVPPSETLYIASPSVQNGDITWHISPVTVYSAEVPSEVAVDRLALNNTVYSQYKHIEDQKAHHHTAVNTQTDNVENNCIQQSEKRPEDTQSKLAQECENQIKESMPSVAAGTSNTTSTDQSSQGPNAGQTSSMSGTTTRSIVNRFKRNFQIEEQVGTNRPSGSDSSLKSDSPIESPPASSQAVTL